MPGAPIEEPPPDRELWPWLLVLVALVIAGIAAAWCASRGEKTPDRLTQTVRRRTVAPLPRTTPKPAVVEATVPKLVGLQAPAALEALAAGPDRQDAGVFSDTPKNEVDRPGSGRDHEGKKGSVVDARGVEGQEAVPVPDVVGQDVAAAIETVKAQGFEVKVVRVPSTEPAGQVVAQAPPAGKDAPGDSTVRLNVSDGAGRATSPPKPTPTPTPTPKPKAKPAAEAGGAGVGDRARSPGPEAPGCTQGDPQGRARHRVQTGPEHRAEGNGRLLVAEARRDPKAGRPRPRQRLPRPCRPGRSRRRSRRHRRGPGDGKARLRAGRLQGRGRRAGQRATSPRTASCSTRTRSRADPRPRNRP